MYKRAHPRSRRAGWLLSGFTAVTLAATPHAGETLTYPTGFRGWTHVKSALITDAYPGFRTEGGLHHIYANAQAVQGYRTGRFPDGSLIVYELLATQEQGGIVSEGERRRVDVMFKDSGHNPQTGGWQFGRFMGSDESTQKVQDAATQCFACHARAAAHGDVFSQIR